MSKQTKSTLIGAMLGAGLMACFIAFLFLTTTVSYKSSLFPGKHIALVSHRSR